MSYYHTRTPKRVWFIIGLFAVLWILLAASMVCHADNADRWRAAQIRPEWTVKLDKCVWWYQRYAGTYQSVQNAHQPGVPATVIACLHRRESDADFSCHLHEGSPLTHRTRYVPVGRIPGVPPPYTWAQSAFDAIYVVDRLDRVNWGERSGLAALDGIESYNGTGYRRRGVPSPYLWSGTTIYTRGKYVADGRYSSTAIDGQPGCAAILLRMKQRGIKLPF